MTRDNLHWCGLVLFCAIVICLAVPSTGCKRAASTTPAVKYKDGDRVKHVLDQRPGVVLYSHYWSTGLDEPKHKKNVRYYMVRFAVNAETILLNESNSSVLGSSKTEHSMLYSDVEVQEFEIEPGD